MKSDIVQIIGRIRTAPTKRIIISTHKNNNLRKPSSSNSGIIKKANKLVKEYTARLNNKKKVKYAKYQLDQLQNDATFFIRQDLDKNVTINYPKIDSFINRGLDMYSLYQSEKTLAVGMNEYGITTVHRNYYKTPILSLPTKGRKSSVSEFNSALTKINSYENDYEARLSDTSSTIFDYDNFTREVVQGAKGMEKKFLEAYLKYPNPEAFAECNGDLDTFNSFIIRRMITENDEVVKILMTDLSPGSRILIKDLVVIVSKLLKIIQYHDQRVTHRVVKKRLRMFVKYKDVKITKQRVTGVEIL